MRSTFPEKHRKIESYNKRVRKYDLRKPWFLQFWAFQVFRSWRIDPSRQVSMFAARAGLPSTIYGIKHTKK